MSYDASNIDVLEGLQAVRGNSLDMYCGELSGAAFHCVDEIIDNCVDEVLNGYAKNIITEFNPDTNEISIEDDGRGIPVDIHPKYNIPAVELIFTKLHAGRITAPLYSNI